MTLNVLSRMKLNVAIAEMPTTIRNRHSEITANDSFRDAAIHAA
ncbi:hypothetical protein BC792_1287 [Sphingobacterium allocomposti]|uniref:Uncharacterized protein n=1 Tax=Sphingobacterium allocomposti TaxID=415956 RepID=A0A5S5D208_9SPHI|nr:hypothetical protein BC792_1287 [Sphingobacterium composti Yoo et al. 2007 non Ten et al. 2007]